MQPHEFHLLVDGYKWRREDSENHAAYFAAQLINVSGKVVRRPVTVKDLVGPLRKTAAKKSRKDDEEYLKAAFKDRIGGGQHSGDSS